MFGDMRPPPDAVQTYAWQTDEDGVPFRQFDCAPTRVAHIILYVTGRQFDDGGTERRITVIADGFHTLTPEQTRQLASALSATADKAEALG
jgi:hypothetical protein